MVLKGLEGLGAGGSVAGLAGQRRGRLQGVISSVQMHTVGDIDERVGHIQRLIRKGSASAEVKEAAIDVLTKRCGPKGAESWCSPAKDYKSEILALFNSVRDGRSPYSMRYTRDHATIDQFTAAEKLLKLRAGDCDDSCILLGSMLVSVGYRGQLRVIQAKGSDSWSHIYLLVNSHPTSPQDGQWIPLDTTVSKPAGWEAPPAIVVRRKDFTV